MVMTSVKDELGMNSHIRRSKEDVSGQRRTSFVTEVDVDALIHEPLDVSAHAKALAASCVDPVQILPSDGKLSFHEHLEGLAFEHNRLKLENIKLLGDIERLSSKLEQRPSKGMRGSGNEVGIGASHVRLSTDSSKDAQVRISTDLTEDGSSFAISPSFCSSGNKTVMNDILAMPTSRIVVNDISTSPETHMEQNWIPAPTTYTLQSSPTLERASFDSQNSRYKVNHIVSKSSTSSQSSRWKFMSLPMSMTKRSSHESNGRISPRFAASSYTPGEYSGTPSSIRSIDHSYPTGRRFTPSAEDITSSAVVLTSPMHGNGNAMASPIDSCFTAAGSMPTLGAITEHSARISGRISVFPAWYDPEKHWLYDVHQLEEPQLMQYLKDVWQTASNEYESRCMLSPIGTTRLSWDIAAVLFLLYELWTTPFRLIFLKQGKEVGFLNVMDLVVTLFFSVDIVLNFHTAYFSKDRIVWRRASVATKYLRTWFLLDFVATVPWDMILKGFLGGGMFSTLRIAKVTKGLKTLRFLRVARAIRIIMSVDANESMSVGAPWQSCSLLTIALGPTKILLALLVTSHINGCIGALLEPHWRTYSDTQDALEMYFKCFWWAFMLLSVGAMGENEGGKSDPQRLLDMVVASERLCLIAWVAFRGLFNFMTFHADTAMLVKITADAMSYLQKRQIKVSTQIQVQYSIWETGRARNMQRHFGDLMHEGLPQELRRKICEELWSPALLSLGLIQHVAYWHVDFIPELALEAQEEALASNSVLFEEQSVALASYYVIGGRLAVLSSLAADPILDFTAGMWVGEKALVNPLLRRSATVVARTMCNLMCLSGESFHAVIGRLGLSEDFTTFCNEFLWRGLCGRCGELGDHFTHACPLMDPSQRQYDTRAFSWGRKRHTLVRASSRDRLTESSKTLVGHIQGALSMTFASTLRMTRRPSREKKDRKLMHFLRVQKLEWIEPALRKLDITDIDFLHLLDVSKLRDELRNSTGIVLSDDAAEALSPQAVEKFSSALLEHTGDMLIPNFSKYQHLIFLSHYKIEAGTEAALIRHELENIIANEPGSPGHQFNSPIFLDSEDLTDLSRLQIRVQQSHNIALLLTKDVLTRPWVIVEIVTAIESGVRVLPVLLMKGYGQFEFPGDAFYESLRDGSLFGEIGCNILKECQIELEQAEECVRQVFKRIAVPYSPHRPENIRKSELQALLKQCRLKRAFMPERAGQRKTSTDIQAMIKESRSFDGECLPLHEISGTLRSHSQ